MRVHPTQLYELVQSLVVFAILWALRKGHHLPGTIFYLYLILAGSMRFIVEFWRANPVVALGMTEYQWISLALVVLGVVLLLYRTKLIKEEKGMAKDPVCGRRGAKSSGHESIRRPVVLLLLEGLQGKVRPES